MSARTLLLVAALVVPLQACDARAPREGPSAACEGLAQLDPRSPAALTPAKAWAQKQHMMGFLEAVEQIHTGTAREDWEAVARGASVLGPKPDQRQACGRPLTGQTPILALAHDFRCRADAIAEAAEARDRKATLDALTDTLRACNGCHRAFRQEVVWETAR